VGGFRRLGRRIETVSGVDRRLERPPSEAIVER
jgi:hypothetical protein